MRFVKFNCHDNDDKINDGDEIEPAAFTLLTRASKTKPALPSSTHEKGWHINIKLSARDIVDYASWFTPYTLHVIMINIVFCTCHLS
jgi:hypothetical protein